MMKASEFLDNLRFYGRVIRDFFKCLIGGGA